MTDRLVDKIYGCGCPCCCTHWPKIDKLGTEVDRLREALEFIARDDVANHFEWQLIAKIALAHE